MSQPSLVPLGTCLSRASTWNPLRASADELFRYIDLSSVNQDTKTISDAREVACGEAPSRARQLVATGDVLVSTVRPNLNGVARVPSELDGATASTGFCVLRPEPKKLDSSYLFQWVKSSAFISDMVSKATGASYPAVSDRIIFESAIPLPPLEEQRRIAAILDQAQTLRTQRRQALAHLDTLTQSLFLDMFGDPVTNPKQLPLLRGDQICSRITVGIVVQPSSYYRDSGVPALRSLNIRPNKILMENLVYFSPEDNEKKLTKTRVRKGDVLLVRTGQPGTAAVVPAELDGVNAIDILIATPDVSKVLADYLCFFYNSDAGKQMVLGAQRGQVQKHLNVGSINAALIPVPPLPLQQTFATRIQAIEALKATHRAALAQLDALFASLQQRAFAGELTAQAPTTQVKRRLAELGQLNALKGVESLVYATKRLPGKGHYWPTKAQYFADKRHLERYGRSIYGETYVAMGRGPVPQAAYNASRALAEGELICEFPMDVVRAALRREGNQLIALRDADMDGLDVQERESLDWAIRYVRELEFDELQTASHDAAWHKTPRNTTIAWSDIIATLEPEVQKRLLATFE